MSILRQNPIIIDMIPVVTRCVGQYQLCQPLNASTTDLARNNSSQGATMVRSKRLSVHLMSKHDSSVGIHGPVQLDRCSIVSVGLRSQSTLTLGVVIPTTYQFVCSLHAHVFSFVQWLRTSNNISHQGAGEEGRG